MGKKRPASAVEKGADDASADGKVLPTSPQEEHPSGSGGEGDTGGSGGTGACSSSDASETSDSDGSSAPDVSDEEAEDPNDPDAFDEVNVTFEFFDPKEGDFHGLKALLTTYLDGEQYDVSGLADTIIAQSTVGTVVKTGEEDDPIAVMSALTTRRYASRPWARQAREHLARKAGDAAARAALLEAWDAEGTALVVNERLINCPPSLAPPLLQGLLDEVAWATEDEPTQEARDAFRVARYLLISRAYADPDPGAEGGGASGSGGGGGGGRQKKAKAAGPVIVYVRPEDEFLHAASRASCTWPVEGRPVAKDELRPLRLAMLVDAAGAAAAKAELDRVVGNAAAMAPPPALPAGGRGKGAKAR